MGACMSVNERMVALWSGLAWFSQIFPASWGSWCSLRVWRERSSLSIAFGECVD